VVQVGVFNELKVIKSTHFGLYLDGDELGEILLPNRYVPESYELGQALNVFLYFDSEDKLIATTETPLAQIGQFANLKVLALEPVGAFLDWGLAKDLFLPFREQTRPLRRGQDCLVHVYLDSSERIAASMRIEKFLGKTPGVLKEGERVDLVIYGKTDLGYKAIINGKHMGMLFANEVFRPLPQGLATTGFIKKIREDGKIDLRLQSAGEDSTKEVSEKILTLLRQRGGFVAITDKTSPEVIYQNFQVSKKKFKIALGGLYKRRLITIDDHGIRLVL
jgi:predicted RNA-binding protein (virulence factor B family)